jgi:thioredoxin 1
VGELPLVTTETFGDEVEASSVPVLLDFWGPRCAPCIALDPFVEELRAELEGRVKVAKVIAPDNRKLCIDLQVGGLPTFLAFKGGQEVDRLTGDVGKESLRELVERIAGASE